MEILEDIVVVVVVVETIDIIITITITFLLSIMKRITVLGVNRNRNFPTTVLSRSIQVQVWTISMVDQKVTHVCPNNQVMELNEEHSMFIRTTQTLSSD